MQKRMHILSGSVITQASPLGRVIVKASLALAGRALLCAIYFRSLVHMDGIVPAASIVMSLWLVIAWPIVLWGAIKLMRWSGFIVLLATTILFAALELSLANNWSFMVGT